MSAGGISSSSATARYLAFCLKQGSTRPLFAFLKRAAITAVPKLRAAASAIIKAGSSKTPWGRSPASRKVKDCSSSTVTDTTARIVVYARSNDDTVGVTDDTTADLQGPPPIEWWQKDPEGFTKDPVPATKDPVAFTKVPGDTTPPAGW